MTANGTPTSPLGIVGHTTLSVEIAAAVHTNVAGLPAFPGVIVSAQPPPVGVATRPLAATPEGRINEAPIAEVPVPVAVVMSAKVAG